MCPWFHMVGVGNFAHNRGGEILVSSDKYTAPKSSLLNYGYRGGGHCNLSRFPKSATATHILHIDDDLQRALRGQPRVAFPPLICTWQWDKHLLPHSFHLWFHLEQRGNSEERRNESHDSEENFLPDLPLYQLLAKYFFSVFTTMLLAFKNKLSEVVEGAESPHWLVQLVCKHLSEQSCQGQVVPIHPSAGESRCLAVRCSNGVGGMGSCPAELSLTPVAPPLPSRDPRALLRTWQLAGPGPRPGHLGLLPVPPNCDNELKIDGQLRLLCHLMLDALLNDNKLFFKYI